jgi:heptaprenyl diphosphate synthase
MASPSERHELAPFFGALCLFFATIEYLFPRPLPFLRLGLANLPILLALGVLSPREVFLVAALKVAGQGLLHGTFASYVFLFSLAGTFVSTSVMLLAHRMGGKRISLIGVSVLGALASNLVQVVLSVAFIFGENAILIAPLFLGIGTASGVVVGALANTFAVRSLWYARIRRDHGQGST